LKREEDGSVYSRSVLSKYKFMMWLRPRSHHASGQVRYLNIFVFLTFELATRGLLTVKNCLKILWKIRALTCYRVSRKTSTLPCCLQ
jgi:hypothetical protein